MLGVPLRRTDHVARCGAGGGGVRMPLFTSESICAHSWLASTCSHSEQVLPAHCAALGADLWKHLVMVHVVNLIGSRIE